ncbi:hypothetical protein Ciccas_013710 [Cichlidogyrus casuarinus]|uniref:Uncharacterized protein n=1 Tax=Cichlidogyrus casuarinus TaxID=1844966 RepID=A0ABD2PJW8_9PLAT
MEKQKLYEQSMVTLKEFEEELKRMVALNSNLKVKLRELEENNKNLRDEHSASTLTIKSYEKQLKEAKEEANASHEVTMQLQKRVEDFIIAEHDAQLEKNKEARRRELQVRF